MAIAINACKEDFLRIYNSKIKREGSQELLGWLLKSDFFEAPASSKYHLCEPGGLCQHSINVYERLKLFLSSEYGNECPYDDETIAVVSLLHDICKCNYYSLSWKNQKTYDSEKVRSAPSYSVKHDAAGDFIWETVPSYIIEEKLIFGHGEKSVFVIMNCMSLSVEEAQAIRYHMGAWNSEEARNFGNACERNPLVFFLHMSDSAATFLDES